MTIKEFLPTFSGHQTILEGSSHGVYIPQKFVEEHAEDLKDFTFKDGTLDAINNGPEDEGYWDAWDDVLNTCQWEIDGEHWTIQQDEDLWLKKTLYYLDVASAVCLTLRKLSQYRIPVQHVIDCVKDGSLNVDEILDIGEHSQWFEKYEHEENLWFTTRLPDFNFSGLNPEE